MKEFEKYQQFVADFYEGKEVPHFILKPFYGHPLSIFEDMKNDNSIMVFEGAYLLFAFSSYIYNDGKFRCYEEVKKAVEFVANTELKTELRLTFAGFLVDLMKRAKTVQKKGDCAIKDEEISLILGYLKEKLLNSNVNLAANDVCTFVSLFPDSIKELKGRLNFNENYGSVLDKLEYSNDEIDFAIYLMENGYVHKLTYLFNWCEGVGFDDNLIKNLKVSFMRIFSEMLAKGFDLSVDDYMRMRKFFKFINPETSVTVLSLIKDNYVGSKECKQEIIKMIVDDILNVVKENKTVDIFQTVIGFFVDIKVNHYPKMEDVCRELSSFKLCDSKNYDGFKVFVEQVFSVNNGCKI
ncbi:MAG: hypothetical protein IKW39_05195 [Alphaproteobacteria bacterium]|nr:hypothetical protein [Alphaproteobacteria bacterium]